MPEDGILYKEKERVVWLLFLIARDVPKDKILLALSQHGGGYEVKQPCAERAMVRVQDDPGL